MTPAEFLSWLLFVARANILEIVDSMLKQDQLFCLLFAMKWTTYFLNSTGNIRKERQTTELFLKFSRL